MTESNIDVAVLVGSLRKESYNLKIAKALQGIAPPNMKLEIVEIRDLNLYNEDLESPLPPAWSTFRERIRRANAVLFVTPEYNRSVPGALKNAIDVGSRPYGKSVFDGKPAAVASVTPGGLGAFGANHHLRQSFVFLNMPTLQTPEIYLSNAKDLIDAEGAIANAGTRELLSKFLAAFTEWIRKTGTK